MHRAAPLLALLLVVPAARAQVVAREGKGWLEKNETGQLVLHLAGTPYEMGYQHGRLLKDEVRKNVERIYDNKTELAKSAEYQAYLGMRGLMHDMLRKHIPERFKEEMRGLAEGAGLPYDQVEAGNLFPEAFHCSGIALRGKHTSDGSLWHVRILDYMTKVGLQDSAVVMIVRPEGMRSWLNVGFAGFIGTVTGMNEDQVAIGEMGGGGVGYWDGVPMAFLIRDALERGETLAAAVEVFEQSKRTCEYYYVVSDGKTRDALGLWCTDEVFERIGMGESYALFQGMKPRKGAADWKAFGRGVKVESDAHGVRFKGQNGVQGFIALQPEDALVLSGPDRYARFMEQLAARSGKVDGRALMEMCKRPVAMQSNLHVAIFHPETLEVWVAVAAPDGSPGCDQPYVRYVLEPAGGPK